MIDRLCEVVMRSPLTLGVAIYGSAVTAVAVVAAVVWLATR